MILEPREEYARYWRILKYSAITWISSVSPETIFNFYSSILHFIVIIRFAWDIDESWRYLSRFSLCFNNIRRWYNLLGCSLVFLWPFCTTFKSILRLINCVLTTLGCWSCWCWFHSGCEPPLKCVRFCLRLFDFVFLETVVLNSVCGRVSLVQ